MSEPIYFESDPSSPSIGKAPLTFAKPSDDFNISPPTPYTIYHLAIIKPHIDSYEIIGPAKTFLHLLPKISEIVSNSPSAIDKLEELKVIEDIWGEKERNEEFERNGFGTMVVEGQRDVYTVLNVLREVKKEVSEALPSPVYTVVKAGPLMHDTVPSYKLVTPGKVTLVKPKGYAVTTRLVGSFVDRAEAKIAAQRAMAELVGSQAGVKQTENWQAGGKGGGVLMAMSPGQMWEVKITYEDQALKRAKEGFDQEGEKVGWRF